MRALGLALLAALVAHPVLGQNAPVTRAPAPSRAGPSRTGPPRTEANAEALAAQRRAAIGDVTGGRFIPTPILAVLADPRIDPNIAYILWQTTRKSLGDWRLSELNFVIQAMPTLAEAGIPVESLQALYGFMGLDPEDLFNPKPALDWQSQSTAFDNSTAASVNAISSADCQGDPSHLTVAAFQACRGGGQ